MDSLFCVINSNVYDSVESVYGCLNFGEFYCKYDDKPYHLIETDEEKTYLMNNHRDIHEMIHITEDFVEVIYHDRYGDGFVTLDIEPKSFKLKNHMMMIDSLFKDNDLSQFQLSSHHIKVLLDSAYIIGEYS